jgi:hypothetical protein
MRPLRPLNLVLLLLTFLAPALARACSCLPSSPQACQILQEASAIFVGTVTDMDSPDTDHRVPQIRGARYIFAINEVFAGSLKAGAVIDSDLCSYHFKKGEQYLVFANAGADGALYASLCSRTQPSARAGILIDQLRASRDLKRVASLFGAVRRVDPYDVSSEPYNQPLRNTTIRIRANSGASYTAQTDDSGEYAFYDLPPGDYKVSLDLPRSLEVGPLQALKLPAGSCFDYNIQARPTSSISGLLLGPHGRPVSGKVELFPQKEYPQGSGRSSSAWEGGFEFNHVAPGTYILVFNNANKLNPDTPYPRTFCPGTSDLSAATPIKVSEDDTAVDADIHLDQAQPTTQILVSVVWGRGVKESPLFLRVHTDLGEEPFPLPLKSGLFSVRLLKNARYTLQAFGYCESNEIAATDSVAVNGNYSGLITMRFSKDECVQ